MSILLFFGKSLNIIPLNITSFTVIALGNCPLPHFELQHLYLKSSSYTPVHYCHLNIHYCHFSIHILPPQHPYTATSASIYCPFNSHFNIHILPLQHPYTATSTSIYCHFNIHILPLQHPYTDNSRTIYCKLQHKYIPI